MWDCSGAGMATLRLCCQTGQIAWCSLRRIVQG
nr:MAG TPA: hypothetical protein [Caudoviricetes sp.]